MQFLIMRGFRNIECFEKRDVLSLLPYAILFDCLLFFGINSVLPYFTYKNSLCFFIFLIDHLIFLADFFLIFLHNGRGENSR